MGRAMLTGTNPEGRSEAAGGREEQRAHDRCGNLAVRLWRCAGSGLAESGLPTALPAIDAASRGRLGEGFLAGCRCEFLTIVLTVWTEAVGGFTGADRDAGLGNRQPHCCSICARDGPLTVHPGRTPWGRAMTLLSIWRPKPAVTVCYRVAVAVLPAGSTRRSAKRRRCTRECDSGQPTSGLRIFSSGNREKSRSALHNSLTP
jgi:hypothetical protein